MKVMVLGSSGMLGHVVETYLNDCGHDVISISRRGTFGQLPIAIDLENWVHLQVEIEKHSPDWIVNAAGLLNDEVDRNPSSAILINSFLPRKLAEMGTEMRFRLITIGSDCVFEGTKGNYSVHEIPDAESAYGRSKQIGEVSNTRDLTIRTSIIGPEIDPNGRGLLQWFMNQSVNADGWATAVWTGVTTLELAKLIESLVSGKVKETGLWHCVPSSTITKFDLLQLMNEVFRQSTINVNKVPGLSHDRSLVNDRPMAWPVPEYSAMMQELKTWIQEHQYLYQGTVFDFVYEIKDSEKL